MAVKRFSDVRRQPDRTLNARQQSIVAIVSFTANGDDSYRYSEGTRRQALRLDGKGQRRTIPGQIQDRVEVNQLIFQIGASIYVQRQSLLRSQCNITAGLRHNRTARSY
ncbi:hypothetical protein NDI44_23480 [Trichocoleus sp. DQ-A3]|uniref:hypothetical protein n=1 Tax=Cyanophyceae TaxID=3028117 RepID=UPI0016872939|nr:hypothetical protein [Coleofasciculus sp. FACHB-125]MBD1901850.1 hypothetical protein [Coleofasciculus sp. FACHB-125]